MKFKLRLAISILLASHSFFWLATSLVSPFLSIFWMNELRGVTITEVGISSLIFFLAFGLLEPVVGAISDRISGFKDDVFLLIFAYTFRGLIFIAFAFATNCWHLYMFQLFLGLSRALAGPSDKALFTHYLGKGKNAMIWGLDDSLINLSGAIGAGVGGYFIAGYGFRPLFVITGVLTIFAGFFNFFLLSIVKKSLEKKGLEKKTQAIPYRSRLLRH